jgi:cytochrome c peroxidase
VGVAAFAALPPVPVPPENPITEQKRVLGKVLFFDEQLSATNTVACATCHIPGRAGTDPRVGIHSGLDGIAPSPDDKRASPGVIRSDAELDFVRDARFGLGVQVTDRTANSNINAGYAPLLFWDGRASGQFRDPITNQVRIQSGGALESQSVNPPASSVEMGHDNVNWAEISAKLASSRPLDLATDLPPDVEAALADNPSYPELFRRAFGDSAVNPTRIAFALGTYQRTLISDQTPWDRFQGGEQNALTPGQIQGMNTFQGARCAACHTPPMFSDHTFRNVGLRPIQEDAGRQNVTGANADRGRFKVPSLRNTGRKASYMHNGQFTNLTDVIRFYARAPGAAPVFPDNRDPLLQGINIPPQAATALEDFLRNGLTDPRVATQSFPFDRAVLLSQRPQDLPSLLPGGTPGTGAIVPRILVDMPGLVGSEEFRIGLDGSLGGASATLVRSFDEPVAGRLENASEVARIQTDGTGAGLGLGTFHYRLPASWYTGGQTLFFQWIVTDPAGQGGVALSNIARVPLFCGRTGCPCPADFNSDNTVDFFDYLDFSAALNSEAPAADFNNDQSLDFFDYLDFVAAFDLPC